MATESVIGTGIDIVENARMRAMIKKWKNKFLDKVFLPNEKNYCESKSFPYRHYAGRFAVKEAVSKAFGTGLCPQIGLLDIEVVKNNKTGAPSVQLSTKAKKWAESIGVSKILISLSHSQHYAVAHAIILSSRKKKRKS